MQFLIVEDEDILRAKYSEYLSHLFERVETSPSFHEAKELLEDEEYDIVLLDYNLPDGNGLKLIELLTSKLHPAKDAPVLVMITGYSKESIAIRSLNLGVFRYLEKPVEKHILVSTFKEAREEAKRRRAFKALSQNFTVSKTCEEILVNEFFVSPREIEIIEKMLIYGKNKLVAEKLGISAGTVRNHLSNLFQKLHVNNKEELREKVRRFF